MPVEALRAALGASAVLTSPEDLSPFTQDWRGRFRGPALCVALPRDTREVAAAVRICLKAQVPILPQGGNTSLCGGSVPESSRPPPVIVNLQRMRRIRAVDPANNAITVDAGCVLASVQDAAEAHQRLFPVSLGAEGSCQIGGNIATNAGGTGVLRYGNMRENVLGLEAVLPDGTVWDGLYALRKNNTGYDLKHLFIGSEGTLGIVTGAVLKLHPLPTARSVAWMRVARPEAALEVLGLFRAAASASLSAFELMNENQVVMVLRHVPGRRCPLAETAGWHVLAELSDTREGLDEVMQSVLEEAASRGLIADAVVSANEAQRRALWEFRHSVPESNRKGGVGLGSDCAVPVSAVPAFIERASAAMRAIKDMPIVVVAHMGDGNLHFIPFLSREEWAAMPEPEAFAYRVRRALDDVAVALGGTFSAEHGVGRTLVGEMARYKPPAELAMMRAVKQALDPHGLFNPGRVLPPAEGTAP